MTPEVLSVDLAFAVTAGLATFFAPCAYPLLPGYVAFTASRTDGSLTLQDSVLRGLTAGLGVLLSMGLLVWTLMWVGEAIAAQLTWIELLVGFALIGFGIVVALQWSPSLVIPLPQRPRGYAGFGVFGAGYALAAVGCVLPVFVGVVGRGLALPGEQAMVMLGVYIGLVVGLMVAVTVASGLGLRATVQRLGGYSQRLHRLTGVVMILAGIGQLYVAIYVLGAV